MPSIADGHLGAYPSGSLYAGEITTGGSGRITVIELGDAVVLLPPGARECLLDEALSAEDHASFVAELDDPDLATT